jgi:riboflavin kinase/FMN adenylyltransferase
MRIIRCYASSAPPLKGAVIALGNFDGVHRGHQSLMQQTCAIAKKMGAPSAVLTFEPHPVSVLKKDIPPFRLTPFHLKASLLKDLGIDILYVCRFNEALSKMTAPDFITELLIKKLGAKHLVTGDNFIFGHKRSGSTTLIESLSSSLGFGYTKMQNVEDAGISVSSTGIRQSLSTGKPEVAAQLLGRNHMIEGRVVTGAQRGRELGFPTANLRLKSHFRPLYGAYVVQVQVEGDAAWHPAVANLGINPMFKLDAPVLEAHIFDWNRNIYGKFLRIQLLSFLRPEQKFESVPALTQQMELDCQNAKRFFNKK